MLFRSRIVLVLVTGIAIGVSLTLGASVLAARHANPAAAPRPELLSWENARLIAEVLHRVQTEYVEPTDEQKLVEAAARGMLSSLDEHSMFLDRQAYSDLQESTSGSYPGIGIEVEKTDEGIRVVRPVEGAPAARAGVLAGDLIIAIDGQPLGADMDAAIGRMRGRAGTEVVLGVRRAGHEQPLQFAIRRSQVEVHSVSSQLLEPGYGYLRIRQFSENTHADVGRAIRSLREQAGKRLDGLVLDLRDNPGGLLDSAVAIADDFLDSGVIVSADGRSEAARFQLEAQVGQLLPGTPVVVLVNGGSASAAEILAGALRDNGRATLVGQKTYGKGSVQTIMPLSDGRAIKLTTSRYFTPSGRSINRVGLTPDLVYMARDEPGADAPVAPMGTVESDGEVRFALATLKNAPLLAGGAAPAAR